MKLIDKIKDLFMDEVDVDDEIEIEEEEKVSKPKIKKEENPLPKVMRDTIKKEEKNYSKDNKQVENNNLADSISRESESPKKFNFPIDFEFDTPSRSATRSETRNNSVIDNKSVNEKSDLRIRRESIIDLNTNTNTVNHEKNAMNKLNELYGKKETPETKPKFKATPVISPVYGILDKNYKKDEVKERNEELVEMRRPSKKVDFETVRKKAFGNLADDIKDNLLCENCELYKEVKKISQLKEDDLLYDMTVDEPSEVTIEKAYDNYAEFGVAYEPNNTKKEVRKEETVIQEETKNNDNMRFDDIVNNVNNIDEAVINDSNELDDEVVNDKPSVTFDNKVDEELTSKEDDSVSKEVPSRSEKKKDEKVDEDFFELIDSMYKERTDD